MNRVSTTDRNDWARVSRLRTSCEGAHRELDRCIRSLGALVDDDTASAKASVELERLLEALDAHFRDEEGSDLYGWLGVQLPELREDLDRLRGQHANMLRSLRALSERGHESSDWAVHIRMTIAELHAHELGERDVLDAAEALFDQS